MVIPPEETKDSEMKLCDKIRDPEEQKWVIAHLINRDIPDQRLICVAMTSKDLNLVRSAVLIPNIDLVTDFDDMMEGALTSWT